MAFGEIQFVGNYGRDPSHDSNYEKESPFRDAILHLGDSLRLGSPVGYTEAFAQLLFYSH